VARPVDVAVIGGGIVGTATAAFLAEAGASVVLYEREALAAGASGRNSGVVQHPFDPALVPLYEETLEIYRRVGEAVGRPIAALDTPPAGLLLVSHDRPGVKALTDELASVLPALRPDFVEGLVLERLEPALAADVVACRLDMGYPIIPSAPTYAFATLAERAGVTIRLGREARPVVEAGRCVGVEIAGRVEPAGAVVVAAGPWTGNLVDPTGAWNPIRPVWGVVVETLLANPPRHVMEEAEMDEALGTGDPSKARDSATAADERPEFSLVTAAGASAVGSTFLETEPDPPAWTERLLAHGTTFVPRIMDAPIREVRACARPMSRDGRPVVGAISWIEGLFVASGHGPWGISTGPASARQIAELVLGHEAGIATEFAPGRFAPPPVGAETPQRIV
jgi:glycine/D-amino acid oxidase-like deaminating enzyme